MLKTTEKRTLIESVLMTGLVAIGRPLSIGADTEKPTLSKLVLGRWLETTLGTGNSKNREDVLNVKDKHGWTGTMTIMRNRWKSGGYVLPVTISGTA